MPRCAVPACKNGGPFRTIEAVDDKGAPLKPTKRLDVCGPHMEEHLVEVDPADAIEWGALMVVYKVFNIALWKDGDRILVPRTFA